MRCIWCGCPGGSCTAESSSDHGTAAQVSAEKNAAADSGRMMKLAEMLESQGTDARKKEKEETGMSEGEYSLIVVIADRRYREEVMKATGGKCGMSSKVHGMVMPLPADGAAGLE